MTENNLFQTQADQPTIDPNKDYLSELVGEGKKFPSATELARGKAESDQFITQLQAENAELRTHALKLREENVAKSRLEELVDRLAKAQPQGSDPTPTANEGNTSAFDPVKVEELVANKIRQHEESKKQLDNFNLVQNKLKERYGANYTQTLRQQTESLGLSEIEVNDLARNNPNVLFRVIGMDQPPRQDLFQAPIRGAISQFMPKVPDVRNWEYYEKMRKDNPNLYSKPEIQLQLHRDAVSLGDQF
jgi:hypothetical protein